MSGKNRKSRLVSPFAFNDLLWHIALYLVFASAITFTFQAHGQEEPTQKAGEGKEASNAITRELEDLKKIVAEQQKKIDEQQKQIEAQSTATEQQKEEIGNISESIEDHILEGLEDEGAGDLRTDRLFNIYGFFDITYMKQFREKDSNFWVAAHKPGSFVVSNFNLYFASQLTEKLDVLSEVRFTFLPHGYESNFDLRINGNLVEDGVSYYSRLDNIAVNPLDTRELTLGGLVIERVQLTYAPFDWLYIRAGRFFTPYGIWNIDHSSTVVLPVRGPYMTNRELVPSRQMGLEVGGRFFPSSRLFMDYAVTLSNGRGPIDTVWDLDENKGVGLRLRMQYESTNVSFSAGGYGYYGRYTDIKKTIIVDSATLMEKLYGMQISKTEEYDEYILAADLRLELFGVLLQSEYVWRYVNYLRASRMTDLDAFVTSPAAAVREYYYPNFIAHDVYVLLAWDLPLREFIGQMHITPYLMYEFNRYHPTLKMYNGQVVMVGVNIKPVPFVALKLEVDFVYNDPTFYSDEWSENITGQVAVFF